MPFEGMNDTQAMLAAKVEDARAALDAATKLRIDLMTQEREARATYSAALIEYGRAMPPKGFWAGDKVKRNSLRRGSYGIGIGLYASKTKDKYVVERGIVTLCEHTDGGRYRNHWPEPGEWFVLSESGATAYKLFDKDGVTVWKKGE